LFPPLRSLRIETLAAGLLDRKSRSRARMNSPLFSDKILKL